jgi:hypothetical protein
VLLSFAAGWKLSSAAAETDAYLGLMALLVSSSSLLAAATWSGVGWHPAPVGAAASLGRGAGAVAVARFTRAVVVVAGAAALTAGAGPAGREAMASDGACAGVWRMVSWQA